MKKTIKVIYVLCLVIILILCFQNIVLSNGPTTADAISSMGGMSNNELNDDTGKLSQIANSVIGLIQVAGTGISMVMVTILGIKYILASPSDKADVKKQIIPLVVGAVILFASVNLVSIVASFLTTTLQNADGGAATTGGGE